MLNTSPLKNPNRQNPARHLPHLRPPHRPSRTAQYNKPSYTVAPDLPKNAKLHGSFHPSFHINHLRIAPFSPFQVTFVLLAKPSNRRFSRPPRLSAAPHLAPEMRQSRTPVPFTPASQLPFHHFTPSLFRRPPCAKLPQSGAQSTHHCQNHPGKCRVPQSLSPSVPETRDPRPQTKPLPPPSPCGNRQACPTFR